MSTANAHGPSWRRLYSAVSHAMNPRGYIVPWHEEQVAPAYLDGPRVLSCAQCRRHLTYYCYIVSKSFTGRGGRAYLLEDVVNVSVGREEERLLLTGLHVVADICCTGCDECIGWTYVRAHDASQKYKEGKFIVEKARLLEEPR